jgi:hypothetical protein
VDRPRVTLVHVRSAEYILFFHENRVAEPEIITELFPALRDLEYIFPGLSNVRFPNLIECVYRRSLNLCPPEAAEPSTILDTISTLVNQVKALSMSGNGRSRAPREAVFNGLQTGMCAP